MYMNKMNQHVFQSPLSALKELSREIMMSGMKSPVSPDINRDSGIDSPGPSPTVAITRPVKQNSSYVSMITQVRF